MKLHVCLGKNGERLTYAFINKIIVLVRKWACDSSGGGQGTL